MTLEDLVPPLALCKQIPEGKFADSVLTWNEGYVKGNFVIEQRGSGLHYIASAPTLQEIMEELYSEADGCCEVVNCYIDRSGWAVDAVYECHDDSGYTFPCILARNNPAAVALKLWLEMEGVKR